MNDALSLLSDETRHTSQLHLQQQVAVMRQLLEYCRAQDWAGHDPYDALNSEFLKKLPLLDSRVPRLALTQLLKRSPINFRQLLLVRATQNPKALALFLMSFIKLFKIGLLDEGQLLEHMIDRLIITRSKGTSYSCWGYSFPWQTRTLMVERGAPNLVCTVFVANALIDASEAVGDQRGLEMAIGAADYLLDNLYWVDGDVACLSYPAPSSRTPVHNANLLGAALLCRVYAHCRDTRYLKAAVSAARYSSSKQKEDGSWNYGEGTTQRWVDNFHTGYNLCALRSIRENAKTPEFDPVISLGFQFYRKWFFRRDGAARYFRDQTYPIDIHSVAQSIITLLTFKDMDDGNVLLAHRLFDWAVANMWDKKGYFYFQVHRFFKSKISYMRWSQAWMLLAIATLLEESIGQSM